jgi:hypothetical protein
MGSMKLFSIQSCNVLEYIDAQLFYCSAAIHFSLGIKESNYTMDIKLCYARP